MKKAILIKAYTALNAGDDLLLHSVFSRYGKTRFCLALDDGFTHLLDAYQRAFSAYPNVTVKKKYNRVTRRLGRVSAGSYGGVVYIGGSIFMENPDNDELDRLLEKEICSASQKGVPYFILNCNFGPYENEFYRASKEALFQKCRDVCFRDRYSKSLFPGLAPARVSPDAVFGYPLPAVPKQKGSLAVSVMDLGAREDAYFALLQEAICKSGADKVRFYDFCPMQGDFAAIGRFSGCMKEKGLVLPPYEVVRYRGDMGAFLESYLSNEAAVCTRFHAMVLSVCGQQAYFPVCYSEKTLHVLDELGFCKHYANLAGLRPEGGVCFNPPAEIAGIRAAAQGVFLRLDEFLARP